MNYRYTFINTKCTCSKKECPNFVFYFFYLSDRLQSRDIQVVDSDKHLCTQCFYNKGLTLSEQEENQNVYQRGCMLQNQCIFFVDGVKFKPQYVIRGTTMTSMLMYYTENTALLNFGMSTLE